MIPLSRTLADRVFDVLVEHAGADLSHREPFIRWAADPETREYRFQGDLGFGGKLWKTHSRIFVTCYPEDETPARLQQIDRANHALSPLHPSLRPESRIPDPTPCE